jgi:hypothetical protein
MLRIMCSSAFAVGIVAMSALTTAAPASASPNPCTLVTTAEASAAMGVSSLPGKPHTSRHASSCRFYSADHTKNVFVQTLGADDMIGAAQIGGKPVPGIGDKALWIGGSMYVKKGGNYMQVGLYRNAESMKTMDPAIIPLAKTVAGRM